MKTNIKISILILAACILSHSGASSATRMIISNDAYGNTFCIDVKSESEVELDIIIISEEIAKIRKDKAIGNIDITSIIKPENEIDDLDTVIKQALNYL
jgi:hypothetical protein